jgi:hypothetical protein
MNQARLFLIIIALLISFFLTYYSQTYLVTENHIYSFYSTQLSYEQIEKMLANQEKWAWVGYAFIPIFYFIKIGLVSTCVYVGVLLGASQKVGFKKIMPAVIKADMVFFVPALIKIVWFTFQTDYTLTDLQTFLPGSLLNFFEPSEIAPWLAYPLQAINIYELGFWVILAFQLKEYFKNDATSAFQTVALSYGSGFVIWVVFIVFLTINLT